MTGIKRVLIVNFWNIPTDKKISIPKITVVESKRKRIPSQKPQSKIFLYTSLLLLRLKTLRKKIDTNKLAKIVAKGSSDLMMSSNKTANELKENVTSKGGTTEAAFEILEGSQKTFYTLLKSAIKNAVKRSKELSN